MNEVLEGNFSVSIGHLNPLEINEMSDEMQPDFDGTVGALIRCYLSDPDSRFHKLRWATKRHYRVLLKVIDDGHGTERLTDIRARGLMRWHEQWMHRGETMASSLKRMLRSLFSFGFTMLEDAECERLCNVMHQMRFTMPPKRTSWLTADQANAVRAEAHRRGDHSIALAQAFQFECMFRQKDVIGEFVPLDEPGTSEVVWFGKKWLRGIRWSEIDENLVIRHTTSKRQKEIEIDLKLAPMVMEELTSGGFLDLVVVDPATKAVTVNRHMLPSAGPVITRESTGRPWSAVEFRQNWRKIATACGIPKAVYNMDSRAGAITEATDAGAPLESVRHAAAHSETKTTAGYSRGSAQKAAEVLKTRVAFRNSAGQDAA